MTIDLKTFFIILYKNVSYTVDHDISSNIHRSLKPIGKRVYNILANNGCLVRPGANYNTVMCAQYLDSAHNINIMTVYGMLGNDVNKFYDIMENDNEIYLVVFMDYFLGIHKEGEESDEIIKDKICGNSDYIYALKTLIEIYMEISYKIPKMTKYLETSIYTKYRYVPAILATAIITRYKKVEEFEFEGMGVDYEMCMKTVYTVSLADIQDGILVNGE